MAIDLTKQIGLTSQKIFDALYSFPVKLQFCHHNTTSYAQHKALDSAYDKANDLKDEIVEQLIGYGIPRFASVTVGTVSGKPDLYPIQLAKEIMNFGKNLEEWAEAKEYCNIENLAQEYSGMGAQLAYLLTLS